MVPTSVVLKKLFITFPDFKSFWEDEVDLFWDGDSPGISADMSVFSHYIRELISMDTSINDKLISDSFTLAEMWLNNGTDEVKDAVATCFLENLANSVSWGRISGKNFVRHLGKESKKYCRAWDEFTGVKTEGL